jgi:hypothetical protein
VRSQAAPFDVQYQAAPVMRLIYFTRRERRNYYRLQRDSLSYVTTWRISVVTRLSVRFESLQYNHAARLRPRACVVHGLALARQLA